MQMIKYKTNLNCNLNEFNNWNISAYELPDEGLVWLTGVMVCLPAAPRIQLFASAGHGWPT